VIEYGNFEIMMILFFQSMVGLNLNSTCTFLK